MYVNSRQAPKGDPKVAAANALMIGLERAYRESENLPAADRDAHLGEAYKRLAVHAAVLGLNEDNARPGRSCVRRDASELTARTGAAVGGV